MEGYIKVFNAEKKFGFIAVPNLPDVFFSSQDLGKEIERDDTLPNRRVKFEVRTGDKGWVAVRIRPAN